MGLETVEAVGPRGVRGAEPVIHWEQALEDGPTGGVGKGREGTAPGIADMHNRKVV